MLRGVVDMKLSLGERVRVLRKKRRLTQTDLSRGITSPSTISQLEKGKLVPPLNLLSQLAKRLDAQPEYFLECMVEDNEVFRGFKHLRGLMNAGQFEAALQVLEDNYQSFMTVVDEDLLESLLASCYEQLKQMDRAVSILERRVFRALKRGDGAAAVHTYYDLGSTCKRAQRVGLAYMYWRRGVNLVERTQLMEVPVITGKLYAALARCSLELDRTADALLYYGHAVKLSTTGGSAFETAILLRELALLLVSTGNMWRASDVAREAQHTFLQVLSLRGACECQLLLARVERLLGHAHTCLELLQSVLESSECPLDGNSQADAYLERALALLSLGRYQESQSALSSALSYPDLDRLILQKHQAASMLLHGKISGLESNSFVGDVPVVRSGIARTHNTDVQNRLQLLLAAVGNVSLSDWETEGYSASILNVAREVLQTLA